MLNADAVGLAGLQEPGGLGAYADHYYSIKVHETVRVVGFGGSVKTPWTWTVEQ